MRSYREVSAEARIDRLEFNRVTEYDEGRIFFGWHQCPRCGKRLRFRLKDFDRHDGLGVRSGLPPDVVEELNEFRPISQGADEGVWEIALDWSCPECGLINRLIAESYEVRMAVNAFRATSVVEEIP
jgi:predicted RNA-binding Zn-ribbon protein involved in translation (DUF1610 family)